MTLITNWWWSKMEPNKTKSPLDTIASLTMVVDGTSPYVPGRPKN